MSEIFDEMGKLNSSNSNMLNEIKLIFIRNNMNRYFKELYFLSTCMVFRK